MAIYKPYKDNFHSGLRPAIIGAGIGGLTTGLALSRVGLGFEVFDTATEKTPESDGLILAPNAMQVFRRLGIEDKVKAAGVEIHAQHFVDAKFRPISVVDFKGKISERHGSSNVGIRRSVLRQILIDAIEPRRLLLDRRIAKVDPAGPQIMMHLDTGLCVIKDLGIAADGVHSMVKSRFFDATPMRYSGQTSWQGIARFRLPSDMRNRAYEMWGPGKGLRFGFAQVGEDHVYFYCTVCAPLGEKDQIGEKKGKLLKQFSIFGDIPVKLIEATTENDIVRTDLCDYEPLKEWWKGKYVLIGDAAHASTPFLQQAGSQTIEDAYVLAICLKNSNSTQEAFPKYQEIRYTRANQAVALSWSLGKLTNIGNPYLRTIRNKTLRFFPEKKTYENLDQILTVNY